MDLTERIKSNIKKQFVTLLKSDKLRQQLRQLDSDQSALVGGMAVISDLYQEQNNVDLQQLINQDPHWKSIVETLRAEAEREIAATDPRLDSQDPAAQAAPAARKPTLMNKDDAATKPVTGNRAVTPPQRQALPAAPQSQTASNRRAAMKFTVDDAPQAVADDLDEVDTEA